MLTWRPASNVPRSFCGSIRWERFRRCSIVARAVLMHRSPSRSRFSNSSTKPIRPRLCCPSMRTRAHECAPIAGMLAADTHPLITPAHQKIFDGPRRSSTTPHGAPGRSTGSQPGCRQSNGASRTTDRPVSFATAIALRSPTFVLRAFSWLRGCSKLRWPTSLRSTASFSRVKSSMHLPRRNPTDKPVRRSASEDFSACVRGVVLDRQSAVRRVYFFWRHSRRRCQDARPGITLGYRSTRSASSPLRSTSARMY